MYFMQSIILYRYSYVLYGVLKHFDPKQNNQKYSQWQYNLIE